MLMETTMCAKKCLMSDKIKERLETRFGKQMDQAADLAVDLLEQKMKNTGDCSEAKEAAEQKLKEIFKQG